MLGYKSCLYNLLAMLTLGLNFPICNMGLIYFSTKRKIKGMEGGLGHMFPPPPSWVPPTRLAAVPRGQKIA